MRALHGGHRGHAQRAVLLVDFARVLLPDEHSLFADVQQLLDVLLADDVAAPERRTLEAVHHLGDIVAERPADGLLDRNLFHSTNPFSTVPAGSGPLPAGTMAITSQPMVLESTTLP